MRSAMFAFLLVGFVSCVSLAADRCGSGELGRVLRDNHTQVIKTLEDRWLHGYAARDTELLNCILAGDFQIGSMPDQTIKLHDKQQVLEWVKRRTGSVELDRVEIQSYGTAVIARGVYSVYENTKLVSRFQFTDFFVYRAHRWQAVARTLAELPLH